MVLSPLRVRSVKPDGSGRVEMKGKSLLALAVVNQRGNHGPLVGKVKADRSLASSYASTKFFTCRSTRQKDPPLARRHYTSCLLRKASSEQSQHHQRHLYQVLPYQSKNPHRKQPHSPPPKTTSKPRRKSHLPLQLQQPHRLNLQNPRASKPSKRNTTSSPKSSSPSNKNAPNSSKKPLCHPASACQKPGRRKKRRHRRSRLPTPG